MASMLWNSVWRRAALTIELLAIWRTVAPTAQRAPEGAAANPPQGVASYARGLTVHTYTHTRVCSCIRAQLSLYLYAYRRVYIYIYMYMYIYVYSYTYIYIYINIYVSLCAARGIAKKCPPFWKQKLPPRFVRLWAWLGT